MAFTFEDIQREISQQNRAQWEQLWNDLLQADALDAGLTAQDIDWDHRVSVGDGGRDIVVKRASQHEVQPLIPTVPSIWSIKSGSNGLLPATLTSELDPKTHPDLMTCLANGGKYFYCVCHPASADQRQALANRALALCQQHHIGPSAITIIHSDHLVEHLKRQRGVLISHCPTLGRSLGLSFSQWSRQSRPLFDPLVPFVELDGRGTPCNTLVDHLARKSNRPLFHLAGLSGVGKTRLVYEACNRAGVSPHVLYYESYAAFMPMLNRLRENAQLTCSVIIDECSLQDATTLHSQLDSYEDRVRAVSIGPARASDRSRDYILILQPPADTSVIALLKSVSGGGVSESSLQHIAKASSHDIRFALLLWEIVKNDPDLLSNVGALVASLVDTENLFRRVLQLYSGEVGNSTTFLDTYQWLTLGRQIGCSAPRRKELEFVAARSGHNIAAMDDLVVKAKRCGLGEAPAHLFEAIPRGMATLIFAEYLWPRIQPTFKDLFSCAPDDSFRQAIMQRVELCADEVKREVRSQVDQYFCDQLGPARIQAIASRQSARAVRGWVELSPESGLRWLAAAFAEATIEDLIAFKGSDGGLFGGSGPRREVIWAVTHLACFAEFYEVCESILFRLAVAENEQIGNNATSEWKERHRITLSNSETPYPSRMEILLERLKSATADTVTLLLDGLIEAVSWPHSGMSPPVVIGGRLVPSEWRPTTNKEVYELFVTAICKAIDVMAHWTTDLKLVARERFISSFDRVYKEDTIPALREFLRDAEANVEYRVRVREAVEEAVAQQTRNATTSNEALIRKLEAWLAELIPQSPAEQIMIVVSRPPWEYDRIARRRLSDQDSVSEEVWRPHYRRAATVAVNHPSVLSSMAPWFEKQSSEALAAFGEALAESGHSHAVIMSLEEWLQSGRCGGICFGFCNYVRINSGTIPGWASRVLDAGVASRPEYVAKMTAAVDPTEAGFDRIVACTKVSGANVPVILERVYGYHWSPVLNHDRQRRVLQLLTESSAMNEGTVRVLVHLLRMYLHAEKTQIIPDHLREAVLLVIRHPLHAAGAREEHAWGDFALKLARTDPELVLQVSTELAVNWERHEGFADDAAIRILTALASSEPERVLRDVSQALAAREDSHAIGPERWQEFFATFELPVIERVLTPLGVEFARRVGQFVPDPIITDEGLVVLRPMTEWYLKTFGADEKCFSEFSIGRWNGRLTHGWAWERLGEIERETRLFQEHSIPALRRWAKERLEQQRLEATRDRIVYEDETKRG